MKKHAILITKHSHGIGGSERYFENITDYLAGQSIQVYVLTNNTELKKNILKKNRKIHVTLTKWPREPVEKNEKYLFFLTLPYYMCKFFFILRRYKRKHHISLVFNQSLSDQFYCAWPAKLLHLPTLWIQGPIAAWFGNKYLMKAFNFFLSPVEAIIAISANTSADFLSAGIAKEKILVINNGIDTIKFHPPSEVERRTIKEKLELQDTFTIGYIGRFSKDKGIDMLLKIMDSERIQRLDITLLIIGDGEYKEPILRSTLLGKRIIYKGFQKEVLPYYWAIDLQVFPTSHVEGMPFTVIESMAAGTPLVCSNIYSLPDIITDSVDGLLKDPQDTDGFIEAIEQCYHDRAFLTSLRKNARKKVAAMFSHTSTHEQTLKLIKEIIYAKKS